MMDDSVSATICKKQKRGAVTARNLLNWPKTLSSLVYAQLLHVECIARRSGILEFPWERYLILQHFS